MLGIALAASAAIVVANVGVGRAGYPASTVEAVAAGIGVDVAMWLVIGTEIVRAGWGRRRLRPWLPMAIRVGILFVTALNVGLILGGHRSALASFASAIAMLVLVTLSVWPIVAAIQTGER